ncbi:putative zinc carboxypeptidase [Cyclospora cayetanensis]|uniref:Zinc carboxypeptidase n=1 Tax=Cyclospora cayetanensis TaxID=88456 RepID=A0A1D3D9R8_9EIME|nr:putative zinc carboxypeptidase [Cyclospora cayetanensis]
MVVPAADPDAQPAPSAAAASEAAEKSAAAQAVHEAEEGAPRAAVAPIPKAQPKAASASSNGRVVATSGDAASGASPSPSGAVGTTSKATHAVASAVLDRLLQGKQPLPLTYGAIRSLLPMLQQRYPHLVRVRDAVEAFGLEDEVTGLMCGRATCQVPFIELGLRSAVNRSTPTLFYRLVGGAFERYLFVGGITWHGGMRAIARPWGSYDHADPIGRGAFQSRRAPDDVAFAALGKWLQASEGPVSSLFSSFLMTAAAQEAGGPSATEYMSPYLSEHFVALQRKQREELLQRLKREHSGSLLNVLLNDDSAEKTFKPPPHPYYPEGPIADLVYPVNGGLEDWAYSAAFQSYPNPISACLIRKRGSQTRHPRDAHSTDAYDFESEPFQDFNQLTASASWWPSLRGWGTPQGAPERSRNQVIPHEREGVRCAMYLVETHDDKNPKPTEYGSSSALSCRLLQPHTEQSLPQKPPYSLAAFLFGALFSPGEGERKGGSSESPMHRKLCDLACGMSDLGFFAHCGDGESRTLLALGAKRGRCSDFVRKEERPLPAGISSEFGEDDHEVYELTSAWHSADVLNDELILQRSCRSAAPWQRSTGQKVEPLYQAWKKDQNEIYNDFSAAERDGLEFLRFKVPPETPSGEICMLLLGEFDKEWTETLKTADPSIEPQSWLVTSRAKNTRANAPKGAGILKSGREWIFPARSPSFPGNPTPVGIPIQIREDSIEAFATVSLSLPAREATASPRGGVAKKVILPVTEPCTVSLTFSGFLNDDPTDGEVRVQLKTPVSRLLGQQAVLTWIPSGSAASAVAAARTAAEAASAASAAVQAGMGISAAAPLAGSQHSPLLSVHVNEDFNEFLLQGARLQDFSEEAAPSVDAYSGAATAARIPLFFPYTRSFLCAFSANLELPDCPPAALGLPSRKLRSSACRPAASPDTVKSSSSETAVGGGAVITGIAEITSFWVKPHFGVTSMVGNFSVDAETDLALLLQGYIPVPSPGTEGSESAGGEAKASDERIWDAWTDSWNDEDVSGLIILCLGSVFGVLLFLSAVFVVKRLGFAFFPRSLASGTHRPPYEALGTGGLQGMETADSALAAAATSKRTSAAPASAADASASSSSPNT